MREGTIKNLLLKSSIGLYKEIYKPLKIWSLRIKNEVNVVFVVNCLAAWKTEQLYCEMLSHPKFRPHIAVSVSCEADETADLIRYLGNKGYSYHVLKEPETIFSVWRNTDIIFYQKPYDFNLPACFYYRHNLRALFCYVDYGFHGVDEKWSRDTELLNLCWQIYYENEITKNSSAMVMSNKCENGVVTGLPFMDELLVPKEELRDPWKKQEKDKKRIIWAPHHSINAENWLVYATFLEYAEFMLELAERYSDKVQWTFKPHPLLKMKVERIWGKDRTDAYWKRWNAMNNSQIESGKYYGLFKHSDAMIHDCGSFTIEYIYSGNPVMYLVREGDVTHGFNEFQQKAFDLHYKGFTEIDIENFILNVIEGKDDRRKERLEFFDSYLKLPYGKSSSENIMESILNPTSVI